MNPTVGDAPELHDGWPQFEARDWPFAEGSGITPGKVWSQYVWASKLNRHLASELANCAKRIHAQREEIKRLSQHEER